MSGSEELPDLAGEYVLGTLQAAEAEAARLRAQSDPILAADIAAWEMRLAPLAMLVPPVAPPPELWGRIESSCLPQAANDNRLAGRLALWRATAVAGLALAAGLAAFIVMKPPPPPPEVAILAPIGAKSPILVAVADPAGGLIVRPTSAIAVPSDRDLELWSLPAGATRPVALGLLPATGRHLPPGLVAGTKILVSLEPKGGSPTGQPTGPVLYGGELEKL